MGLGKLAESAGSAIIGSALGMGLGKFNDHRQYQMQEKLQGLQIKGQKELASNAHELQLDSWNKTNYGAQMEHLKKAGLNPALLYGMGGTGGATMGGVAGGAVSGGEAPKGGGEMGMGMQMALMNAQKENIEADTANKKAAAENTELQTDTGKQTQEATIQTIKEKAFQQLAETGISEQNRAIGAETQEAKISKIKAEAIGAVIENKAKETGVNLDQKRIEEITESIQQRWKALELEGKSIEQSKENMEKLTEAMLWGAGIQAAGNIVRDVVDIATRIPNKGTKTIKNKQTDKGYSTETIYTSPNK